MKDLVSLKYNLVGGNGNMSLSDKIKFIENIKNCNGQKIKFLLDKTHMQTAYNELSTDPVDALSDPDINIINHKNILLGLYDQINFTDTIAACYLDDNTRKEDDHNKSVIDVRNHLEIFYRTAFEKGGRIRKILLKGTEHFIKMGNSRWMRATGIIDWGFAGFLFYT